MDASTLSAEMVYFQANVIDWWNSHFMLLLFHARHIYITFPHKYFACIHTSLLSNCWIFRRNLFRLLSSILLKIRICWKSKTNPTNLLPTREKKEREIVSRTDKNFNFRFGLYSMVGGENNGVRWIFNVNKDVEKVWAI